MKKKQIPYVTYDRIFVRDFRLLKTGKKSCNSIKNDFCLFLSEKVQMQFETPI